MKYRQDNIQREKNTIYIDPYIKLLISKDYKGTLSQFLEEMALLHLDSEEHKLNKIKELEEEIKCLKKQMIQDRERKRLQEEQIKITEKLKAINDEELKRKSCAICGNILNNDFKEMYNKRLCKGCFMSITKEQIKTIKKG